MASALEFRTIQPGERDAVLDLLAQWFNDRAFFARYFAHDPGFRDELCFVAIDAGRIVSTLQVFRKAVRVNGAVVQVGGVGNVFTTAEYRERGISSQLLTQAVSAMDAHGFDLSLLFAVRLAFYGRLGWRSHVRHLIFIERGDASSVATASDARYTIDRFTDADLEDVRHVYDAYSAGFSGSTVRDLTYWRGQLRVAGNPREDFLVARAGAQVVAYARGTPLYDFYVVMEHGCLPGHDAALSALVARLHGTEAAAFPGTITQLAIAPTVQTHLRARGLTLRLVEDVFWMWRVISPQRLAAKLGLTDAEADADELFDRLLPADRSVYWISDRF